MAKWQGLKKWVIGLGGLSVLALAADSTAIINFATGWNLPTLIGAVSGEHPRHTTSPVPVGVTQRVSPGVPTAGPSSDAPQPEPDPSVTDDSVAPSAPQPTYLSEMQADHTDEKSGTGTAESDVGYLNGHAYGHSIIMNPGCQNDDGGDMWAEYDLGRKYGRLTVAVGSSEKDPSDSKFRYKVLGDGVTLASGSVTKLRTAKLNVNVQGHLTLRLMISDPRAPERSCGFSDSYRFVWGDAELLP